MQFLNEANVVHCCDCDGCVRKQSNELLYKDSDSEGDKRRAVDPEIDVPARTKISRCLRSYSCRRLQVLKFQHDSASDGSTLTISTLVHLRKNRTSHIKRI